MVTDTAITDLRPQGYDPRRQTIAILALNVSDGIAAYNDTRIFEPEKVANKNVRIVFAGWTNLSGIYIHTYETTSRAAQHPNFAAAVNALEIAVALTNGDV